MGIYTKKIIKNQNTLIYGGGAIGSYLSGCLAKTKHNIFFLCRNNIYTEVKKNGLIIKVFNNLKLKKKIKLKESKKFRVIKNLKNLGINYFDSIFITTKINQNLFEIFKNIEPFISKKTIIVTPCTSVPFWWYQCLGKDYYKKFERKLNYLFLKNIKRKNLVGMTMWLSGKIIKPGEVIISHIQRGFPIKEVFKEKKIYVDRLRQDLRKTTISPKIKNIFSEIFLKSINSLAFNLIALKYRQNNKELNKNKIAIKEVLKILKEGDKILKINKINIPQSPISRIKQTLKSKTHTMSMLHALENNKKIELYDLWESFVHLTKIIKYKMVLTKKIYSEVVKKIK